MSAGRPRPCPVCKQKRRAHNATPYCYDCMPGGPFPEPPCRRCGSTSDYFSAGLCASCHHFAPPKIGSCRECFAWGVTRRRNWLCHGCYNFQKHRLGACASCGRTVHLITSRDICRLCWKNASGGPRQADDRCLDPITPNRHGQQLFFADMTKARAVASRPRAAALPPALLPPVEHRQLILFDVAVDLSHGYAGMPPPKDSVRAAGLDNFALHYAAERHWAYDHAWNVRAGIRLLLSFQHTPGASLTRSEADVLRQVRLPVRAIGEVLTAAGWWQDDRVPAIERWFNEKSAGLPEPMAGELRTWFDVMRHGSTSPPRRVPRSQTTVRLYTGWVLPSLEAWAAAGHRSLREIATDDVLAVLPQQGTERAQTCRALRSVFTLLRQRKLVFADPTSRIHAWVPNAGQPLPVDPDLVRQALNDLNPARAAVAALVCFHGLRVGDLRALQLGDLRDGRLRLGDRVIVLAEPVATRLRAWIEHRTLCWPHSLNPHLFIHCRSATRTEPVGQRWVKLTLNLPGSVQALREDRILHEAHATAGDARRLHDFFGLSIQAALRYTATVDHPDLIDWPGWGSRS